MKNRKSITSLQDLLESTKKELADVNAKIAELAGEIAKHPDNPKLTFYRHKTEKWNYILGVNKETAFAYLFFADGRVEMAPHGWGWNAYVGNYGHTLSIVARPELTGFPFPYAS